MRSISFAVDLVTFFHVGFWGVEERQDIGKLALRDPKAFWDRMLSTLQATGIEGIELTFAPFGPDDAAYAYGSLEAFRRELETRGLRVASGFYAGLALDSAALTDPARRAFHMDAACACARQLAELGSELLILGMPMREPGIGGPAAFDIKAATLAADFCNELGRSIHPTGTRLALHNEAHSAFAFARDIDLLMLLTDPLYVHLCLDTGHALLMGVNPVDVAGRYADRLLTAHFKDADGPVDPFPPTEGDVHAAHHALFRPIGQGRIDWAKWIGILPGTALGRWAILEIDASADPARDIVASLEYIRSRLGRPLGRQSA